MKSIVQLPAKLVNFFKSVFQEFKLVEKITFRETAKLTFIVISISVILSLTLAVLDKGFMSFLTKLLS